MQPSHVTGLMMDNNESSNMNSAPQQELKIVKRRKTEKLVVDFRLDKGTYTPFINRLTVKLLRKYFPGHYYCQHFKRGQSISAIVKKRQSENQEL